MTTRTTNHLALGRRAQARRWIVQHDRAVFAASVLVVATLVGIAVGAALYRAIPPSTVSAPTPSLPIILIATPVPPPPTLAPVQQVAAVPPNTLTRAVVAYDAPNGAVLGAIEAGRSYQLIERYGADWLHADVDGSGAVWLRSADVTGLPSDLADVQPPPPPVIVERPIYIAAHPAAQSQIAPVVDAMPTPGPIYQPTNAPPADTSAERQQNIQGHYVDPSVAQQWAQEAWRQEHCVGDLCIP